MGDGGGLTSVGHNETTNTKPSGAGPVIGAGPGGALGGREAGPGEAGHPGAGVVRELNHGEQAYRAGQAGGEAEGTQNCNKRLRGQWRPEIREILPRMGTMLNISVFTMQRMVAH